ncbi:right-handed parallel beta-helix repeat-containing protein [bacterium]|nr:right-handed parallel beta-helix repeat-containing protein [bacterium]
MRFQKGRRRFAASILAGVVLLNAAWAIDVKVSSPAAIRMLDLNGQEVVSGDSVRVRTSTAGAAAPTFKMKIKNLGTEPLTIRSPQINPPFRFVKAPAPSVVQGTDTLVVIAMDTATTGTFGWDLTFSTNDPAHLAVSVTVNGVVQSRARVMYVSADSAATSETAGIGESWALAYPNLQWAIAAAQPGNEIWVKAGTYKPTTTGIRSVSFVMPEDVSIYGGFAGNETTLARDWKRHPSILSGDLGTTYPTDNSYHVLIGRNLSVIDGFTIRDGYASEADAPPRGGAIYMVNVSPTVSNCTFLNNTAISMSRATAHGGAIDCVDSSPEILNCIFAGNSASATTAGFAGFGGAICLEGGSSPILVNCVFANNIAGGAGWGGAIYSSSSEEWGAVQITNCTFASNVDALKWAIYMGYQSGSFTLTACIFWNNGIYLNYGTLTLKDCDLQNPVSVYPGYCFLIDGGGNISADPTFLNVGNPVGMDGIWRTSDDGLTLLGGSPCINAGTETATPPTDITGRTRVERNDIGAYEYPMRNATGGWMVYE